MDIVELLRRARKQGASDLHLVAGNPPLVRVNGSLGPLPELPCLTADDIDGFLTPLTSQSERADFQRNLELDFGRSIADVGRVRCNVARQQGTTTMVCRLLPPVIPKLEELNVPAICKDLVLRPRGLVVVSGPTGSGKSTTLAAMIDYLNANESRRVITVEDPIEYVYSSDRCVITQRELGGDTLSFAAALKHVLRQDPDVIMVGEMRDLETASAALTIAETGHLVLTTGHAPSSPQAIERIVDLFPPYERNLVQTRLASLLLGVLCQILVPRADGSGRVPAVEVMLATPPVRNLIREGKIFQLPNVIRTQAREGMQLMDQSLLNLFREGLISRDSLLSLCNDRAQTEGSINLGPGATVAASTTATMRFGEN